MSKVTATFNEATKTMSVTFRGDTREFPAFRINNRIHASDVFGGKFRSGTKIWPMAVLLWDSGNVTVAQGGFSNKGGAITPLGWYETANSNNSQHNGQR